MIFYNQQGKPIAYTDDNKIIYLFSGHPVAYFYRDVIYGFNGHQFGWFLNGWVRDLKGNCVFFTDHHSGSGPAIPARHAIPARGAKYAIPARYAIQAVRSRPAISCSWSDLSNESFFKQ